MESMEPFRQLLKSNRWDEWQHLETDQRKKLPAPPIEKPIPDGAQRIALVPPAELNVGRAALLDILRQRESRRQFNDEPLTQDELSFLLWATQGVISYYPGPHKATHRTAPSGGARHPFETYLVINRVTGLEAGLYRYLPEEHQLLFLRADAELGHLVGEGCNHQPFVGRGAVIFIWSAIPYRTEWRYAMLSHKIIAMDAGHMCQNLYLAAESIGAGTCGIGAYHQDTLDALMGLDGKEEFVLYIAPVGRLPR